jgi:hypothetical protein
MQLISWVGNVFICLGLWHIGNKKRWAFLLSILGEMAWIIYSLQTRLWSLAFICCVFATLAARSWVKWGKSSGS